MYIGSRGLFVLVLSWVNAVLKIEQATSREVRQV
jgi:hypothetical protein